MVSTHAQKLACEIVREQFGDISQVVIRSLVYRGQQTLAELQRDTQLSPPSLLKNGLLVLIQHNCVQSYQNEDDINAHGIPVPAATFYVAELDKILHRLRYASFLVHIRDNMGSIHESVAETVLENGRMSHKQLFTSVARKQRGLAAGAKKRRLAEAEGAEAAEGAEGEEMEEGGEGVGDGEDDGDGEEDEYDFQDRIRVTFASLVREHYLERAPAANNPPPPAPEPFGGKGGRGKASNAAAAMAEAAAAAANAAAMKEARERYQLPSDVQHAASRKRKAGDGGGMTIDGLDDDIMRGGDLDEGDVILWRVNHEELCRRFRHAACVKLVREKVHAQAGVVMEGMLSLTRQHEDRLKQERSVPLSVQDVEAVVASMDSADKPTGGAGGSVKEVLRQLADDSVELISRVGEGPGGVTYCINLKRIIEVIQLKELEAVVRERFGAAGCRVFRLLVLKRQLEQKQIAEMAMIPTKETRELLYCLLKAEYVSLQEVAKTSDHAPSRTFYLWRVELGKVGSKLSGELYKAASNLRTRLEHHFDEHAEVLRLLESNLSGQAVTITASQKRQLDSIKRIADVLQSGLMRLDRLVMLFNDWA